MNGENSHCLKSLFHSFSMLNIQSFRLEGCSFSLKTFVVVLVVDWVSLPKQFQKFSYLGPVGQSTVSLMRSTG